MSETKFTPGPWGWVEQYRGGHAWLQSASEKFTIGNAIIDDGSAYGEYPPRIAVNEANAHLIAAAPDLYEALERLLPMAEDDCFQYGNSADEDEDIIFARAALAKARGEA